MRDVNLSLITKLGWKLLNNADTMWVGQLRGKYLHSCSFLSPQTLSTSSWLWKGILQSIPIISKGACFKIHDSSSLPIWSSPWIPTLPHFTPLPFPSLPQPQTNLIVSDLFSFDPNSQKPYWNTPLLEHLFDANSVRAIQKINISSSTTNSYLWTPSTNGLFSTKTAYKIFPILDPPLLLLFSLLLYGNLCGN